MVWQFSKNVLSAREFEKMTIQSQVLRRCRTVSELERKRHQTMDCVLTIPGHLRFLFLSSSKNSSDANRGGKKEGKIGEKIIYHSCYIA